MRIVKLQAENIKKIKAVQIEPDSNVVVIAGRNGQGKTSVLDSIWLGLEYAAAKKGMARPIRDGEHTAGVMLNLGDLVVTRTWREGAESKLVVSAPNGATFSSPQAMLDKLIGDLSFDPLAFTQQDDKAQLATLLSLVELPFVPEELEQRRRDIFDTRTVVGRNVRHTEALLAKSADFTDVPDEEINVSELLAQHRAAIAAVANVNDFRSEAMSARRNAERIAGEIAELERTLADRRQRLAEWQHDVVNADEQAKKLEAELPDVAALEAQIEQAEQTNRKVREKLLHARDRQTFEELQANYQALTRQLTEIDEEKRLGLAQASFPVPGLGFDENGVTYGGIPFRQCSAAERLRVSIAMAMALNPELRVIRITDGSLLDSTNLALIEEMADQHDYQIWIERVDESGQVGITIEDGQVVR